MKTLIYLLILSSITAVYNKEAMKPMDSNSKSSTGMNTNTHMVYVQPNAGVKKVHAVLPIKNNQVLVSAGCNEESSCTSTHHCNEGQTYVLTENHEKVQSKKLNEVYQSILNNQFGKNYKVVDIKVSTDSGCFHSINEAVKSISQLAFEVKYNILVGAGVYIEETIDLTGRPNVNIIGEENHGTIIKAANPKQNIFILGALNEVSFLRLTGTDGNTAAIVCNNSGDFAIGKDLIVDHCGYGIVLKSNKENLPTAFLGDRIEMVNIINNPFVVEASQSGNVVAHLQNLVVVVTTGHSAGILVSGNNASVNISSSCFHKSENLVGVPICTLHGGKFVANEIHLLGWENNNLMAIK